MRHRNKVVTIILNWNGAEDSFACIAALKKQTLQHTVVAVDNGSTDSFVEKAKKIDVVLLENKKNLGFSGGVNTGIRYAIENKFDSVALINNDALPDPEWLESLSSMLHDTRTGVVTGKLLRTDGNIDSTGDQYTSWGLAYPRGRDTKESGDFDKVEDVFAATGGASLYRVSMLKEIGLFDEDFFAYYEDVDMSFRAQLAGWKVVYTPNAVAYHKVGASSGKVPGLTTYMTIKNLPWLLWKNVPLRLLPAVIPRFTIAYTSIVISSLAKGRIMPTAKGLFMSIILMPKKLYQRWTIQRNKKVTANYIKSMMTYDLPPNAHKLIKLRSTLRKLRFWS